MWPYGAANGTTLKLAKEHGYKMAFTLNEGLANAAFLDDIPRVLISDNPSLKRFASQVAQVREPQTMRVMHVDLDYVYDKDPAQQKRNIDKLIQRVYDMRISHVFLQAYADPKGDGNIRELYFPNRWLPMRADLFKLYLLAVTNAGRGDGICLDAGTGFRPRCFHSTRDGMGSENRTHCDQSRELCASVSLGQRSA